MAGMSAEQFASRIEGRVDVVKEAVNGVVTDCLANLRALEKLLDEREKEIAELKAKYEPEEAQKEGE